MDFFKSHLRHSKKSSRTNGKPAKSTSSSEETNGSDLSKEVNKMSLDSKQVPKDKAGHKPGVGEIKKEKPKHKHFYSKFFHHKSKPKLEVSQNEASPRGVRAKLRDVTAGMNDLDRRRYERLTQIANLEAYMSYTRRTCSDDDIPIVPNRLCCAIILQESLIRQERQYIKDVLHGRLPRPNSDSSFFPSSETVSKQNIMSSHTDPTRQKTPSCKQSTAPKVLTNHKTAPNLLSNQKVTGYSTLARMPDSCGESPDEDEEDTVVGFHLGGDEDVDDDGWLQCYQPPKQGWRSGPVFPQQQFDIY